MDNLRQQCCDPSGQIVAGQLCLADGQPARFGRWVKNNEFVAYVRGRDEVRLPWTKLQRHLTDEELKTHFA